MSETGTAIQEIRFSFNWNNKLTNKAFTTIRVHNPKKYRIGARYIIEAKGMQPREADCKAITTIKGSQLNEFICFLDTGYCKAETMNILKKMYPRLDIENTLFDFCLLVYAE